MTNAARADRKTPEGPFGEADLEADRLGTADSATVYPKAWQPGQSDIHALTVPPGEFPSQNLPGTIEEAVLAVLDQVPRGVLVPNASPDETPHGAPPSDDVEPR